MATTNERDANLPMPPIVADRAVVGEATLPRLPSGKVDVAVWIQQLGVAPIDHLEELVAGIWPDDEPVDEFLAARRMSWM